MSATIETKQRVLLIRELIEKGYKDKQVCMIAQAKQPYVSKVRHRKIHANVELAEEEKVVLTDRQLSRMEALNQILSLPDFISSGMTNEHDLVYIHVLKFFLAEKEEVYSKLYFHLSKKHFSRLWATKNVDIRLFDCESIGVNTYDYLDLIIDFFI